MPSPTDARHPQFGAAPGARSHPRPGSQVLCPGRWPQSPAAGVGSAQAGLQARRRCPMGSKPTCMLELTVREDGSVTLLCGSGTLLAPATWRPQCQRRTPGLSRCDPRTRARPCARGAAVYSRHRGPACSPPRALADRAPPDGVRGAIAFEYVEHGDADDALPYIRDIYQRIMGAHTVDLAEQSAAVTQRLVAPLLRGLAIEDPHSTSARTGARRRRPGGPRAQAPGRTATRDVPCPAARAGASLAPRGLRTARTVGCSSPGATATVRSRWAPTRRCGGRRAPWCSVRNGSLGAKVPYQLRHAAVSLWLNAGVPATQVAEWAGHSVHVLLKVYAKCIDGQDEAARRRIEDALGIEREDPERRPGWMIFEANFAAHLP